MAHIRARFFNAHVSFYVYLSVFSKYFTRVLEFAPYYDIAMRVDDQKRS